MSTTASNQTVALRVFADRHAARQAVAELKRAGFTDDQIGVMTRDDERTGADSAVVEGAGIGAAAGASLGALWALGMMAGMLPAIGPVVAGGWLMSILASAGGTAAVGALVGALVGLGVPEEDARYYEGEVTAGRTLVTVRAQGRLGEAMAILNRFGGYGREGWRVSAPTETVGAAPQSVKVPVHRDDLGSPQTPAGSAGRPVHIPVRPAESGTTSGAREADRPDVSDR
jgi:hypothetical protein